MAVACAGGYARCGPAGCANTEIGVPRGGGVVAGWRIAFTRRRGGRGEEWFGEVPVPPRGAAPGVRIRARAAWRSASLSPGWSRVIVGVVVVSMVIKSSY